MKFLVIDDHPLSRDGTRLALQACRSDAALVEAGDLDEAMEAIYSNPDIDLILLDLELQGTQGVSTLHALRAHLERSGLSARVVVLSGHSELPLLKEVLQNYGTGYILKASSRATFAEAIALTLAGGIHVPEPLMRSHGVSPPLDGQPRSGPRADARWADLTPREMEVAALLVEGHTYKRIAKLLARAGGPVISEHTVRVHVGNIAWKLGVTENAKSGVMVQIARLGLKLPSPGRGPSSS